jgi:solute carrier family 6 (neurotransmitter transporter)
VETYNNTWKLEETLPDYYNGHVLLRSSPSYPHTFSGELRFQTLFHIIVIWMSVFIGLSKGLRSYGKVVYVFAIFPLVGFLVFSTKVIGLLPLATFKYWINSTHWLELLYNGNVS